jgi:hypothetical protein
MDRAERAAILEEGFFDGPWFFLGKPVRPLTLGTVHICHSIGVPVLRGERLLEGLSVEEQTVLMGRFMLVHETPVEDLSLNFREGTMPALEMSPAASLLPLFAEALQRFRERVEAASVSPLPRASWDMGDAEDAPPGHIDPSYLHDFVWTLSGGRYDPAAERAILWELPFVRALGYYHCKLQDRRFWTLPKGPAAEAEAVQISALSAALQTAAAASGEDDAALL